MQNPDKAIPTPVPVNDPLKPWHTEVGELLAQAAMLCAENGLDVDTFMKTAWSAYIGARPGLREHLEEMQLRHELDELRKLGRLAEA